MRLTLSSYDMFELEVGGEGRLRIKGEEDWVG